MRGRPSEKNRWAFANLSDIHCWRAGRRVESVRKPFFLPSWLPDIAGAVPNRVLSEIVDLVQ